MTLNENARVVIERRIATRDTDGNPLETADEVFQRVANNIAQADYNYGKSDTEVHSTVVKFYNMMNNLDFLPNSPTLVNAGKELQQLSACFVIPVEDSMEGIFESIKQAALIHKTGGGTGFSFSKIRAANSNVSATSGIASGPVSFMQVFDKATEVIKQGGTRRGANMGILRVDHPDILEFIHIKDNLDKLTNFNISVAITEEFMNSLSVEGEYELVDPASGPTGTYLNSRSVWNQLIESAHTTGDPGVIFIDRINGGKANPVPFRGPIEATNPCGEQPLYPWDSCNLGSINLNNFVIIDQKTDQPRVDIGRLTDVVHDAVHFLDNVIDMNRWPNEQIESVSRAVRRIGLGVMGWADMLIKLKIPYNSDEAFALAETVMGVISGEADKKSIELGMSRGSFPDFDNSIYSDWPALRNSTRTTIAPTGTISIIAGCSSGIEPLFALKFTRSHYLDKDPNKRHEMTEIHPEFTKWLDAQDVPNQPVPAYFITANEISPAHHVMMQAAFQNHTDNAVSKTINMKGEATKEDVEASYLQAYLQGCNGITIYRDGSRSQQVLTVGRGREGGENTDGTGLSASNTGLSGLTATGTVQATVLYNKDEKKVNEESISKESFNTREGVVHKFSIGDFEGYLIVGIYQDGNPRDVFIVGNKVGSATRGYLDTIGILISSLLRSGVSIKDITPKLSGIRFEPSGLTSNPDLRISTSIVDYVGRWLERRFELSTRTSESEIHDNLPAKAIHGDLCGDCGQDLYYAEGCLTCLSCGWSKCG